jgi:protoheme IX farnesyltransferase
MLPVVHGEHVTAVQIVIYAILTAVVSIIPLAGNGFNSITLGLVVLLNVGLLAQSLGLLRSTTRPKAKSLFKYSMVYLALFFLVVAVDRAI